MPDETHWFVGGSKTPPKFTFCSEIANTPEEEKTMKVRNPTNRALFCSAIGREIHPGQIIGITEEQAAAIAATPVFEVLTDNGDLPARADRPVARRTGTRGGKRVELSGDLAAEYRNGENS